MLECGPAAITTVCSDAAPGWERYVKAVEHELAALGRPDLGIRGS